MKVTDEILEQVFREQGEYTLQILDRSLPSDSDQSHAFSEEFERKMRALIRKQRRKPPMCVALRQVAMAAACVGVISLSAVSVWAARTWTSDSAGGAMEGAMVYTDGDVLNEEDFSYTEPTYIPEDFQEVFREEHSNSLYILYEGNDNTYVEFSKDFLDGLLSRYNPDNPKAKAVTIWEHHDGILLEEKGRRMLVWRGWDAEYTLIGNITRAQLIKIAQSVSDI